MEHDRDDVHEPIEVHERWADVNPLTGGLGMKSPPEGACHAFRRWHRGPSRQATLIRYLAHVPDGWPANGRSSRLA